MVSQCNTVNIYSYIYMNSSGTSRRFNLDAEKWFYSDPEVPTWCVISNWYPDQTAACRLIVKIVSNLPAFVKTEVVHLLTVTVCRELPEYLRRRINEEFITGGSDHRLVCLRVLLLYPRWTHRWFNETVLCVIWRRVFWVDLTFTLS